MIVLMTAGEVFGGTGAPDRQQARTAAPAAGSGATAGPTPAGEGPPDPKEKNPPADGSGGSR